MDFQQHYTSFIRDILAMPSGQHTVDPVRLEKWIQAQHTVERQTTARSLAEQIKYIPHSEVITICANILEQIYTKLDLSRPIVWWVGKQEKSGYIISLLCYHALKERGYPEPTGFVESPVAFDEDVQYVYFDDMSYSGSQLKELQTSIVFHCMKENPRWE